MDKEIGSEACQSIYENLIELCKNRPSDMKASGYIREWLQTIRCDKFNAGELLKKRRKDYKNYLGYGIYKRICDRSATEGDNDFAVDAVAHYKNHDIAVLKSALTPENRAYHEIVVNGERTLVVVALVTVIVAIGAHFKKPFNWLRIIQVPT